MTLAGRSPLEVAGELTRQVLPMIAGQDNLHMRFRLLEEARREAEKALPALEDQLTQAVLPLGGAAAQAALSADNLLKGLALAYAAMARGIVAAKRDSTQKHLLQRSAHRAAALVARRQLLAYRAYAQPSPASWKLLHEIYGMACDPPNTPLNGETAAIEHEYLGALLFARLEPNRLPHAEFDRIHACIRRLAAVAVITDNSPEALAIRNLDSCFLVRPDQGTPGSPLNRLPPGESAEGGLIVDCAQVLVTLDRSLAGLPGSLAQAEPGLSPALLRSLRTALGGSGTRRFGRAKFRPRADLIGGLDQVIAFLDGNALSRRALDAAQPPIASEWSLIDESPDGFRIRFIKGERLAIGIGHLVALQPRESSRSHVCLVRRIASGQGSLELGLQLLSPQAGIVRLTNGGDHPMRAVYLPSLPAFGPFAGIIAPPGRLKRGEIISLATTEQTLRRRIGKCIEAHEGLEFIALDPIPD